MGYWTMVSFYFYEYASMGKWSGSVLAFKLVEGCLWCMTLLDIVQYIHLSLFAQTCFYLLWFLTILVFEIPAAY